jgi:hypothetical protein
MASETLFVTGTAEPSAAMQVNTTSPIDFGIVHAGATAEQAISVTNIGPADGTFLTVYSGGASGAASINGTIVQLAPGATDATDMVASLNTSADGVRSGLVYLNEEADPGNGGALMYLGTGTVAVQGTVYNLASPSLTGPAAVYLHQGDTATEALTVANNAPADGYSETLNATVTGFTGALAGASGSVTLAPTSTDNSSLTAPSSTGWARPISAPTRSRSPTTSTTMPPPRSRSSAAPVR